MPVRIPDGLSFNEQIEKFANIPKGETVDELVLHLCVWDKAGDKKLPKPDFKVRKLVVLPTTILSKGNDVDAYGAMHAMRSSARTLEQLQAPATPWLLKYFRDTDRTKFTALQRAVIDRSLHPSVADALIEILDEIVTANKRGVELPSTGSPPAAKKSKKVELKVEVDLLEESEGEGERRPDRTGASRWSTRPTSTSILPRAREWSPRPDSRFLISCSTTANTRAC